MVYGRQSMRVDANLSESQASGPARVGTRSLARIIGMMMVVLLAGSTAFGEFLVQPIILKKQVQPGRRVPIEFKIENLSRNTTEQVSLRIADLTQDANGVWMEVAADDPNNPVDVATLRSCKSWLTCTVESVQLDPYQIVPVTLVADIPAGTRGFYFATLIAQTAPRETEIDGYTSTMSVQYLVPVILESQNIPLPHDVKLTDVALKYRPATVENPAASVIATMDIVNKGGTYSRLMGQIRIWQQSRGYWRKTADLTLPETGIIPGVSLNLKQEVGSLLSNGRYKIEGYLHVDGRRGNAIQKEIDFEGDPRTVVNKVLVPIDLDKEDLLIDVTPGSTRMGSIQVGNGSEEQVTVNAEFILPEHMLNVVNGRGIKGDELGCAEWVTIQPQQFTLQRYGRRNLNVVVRMPATATQYSHYYGTLRLHVTYPDGSPGGTKLARVCLKNGKVPATNLIDPTTITMSFSTASRYIVTASFLNGGVTHVRPKCRGLLTGEGDAKYKQFLMSSEAYSQTGIFLPFESRTFSGILDLTDIPPGAYRLTAVLEYPERNAQNVDNPQNQILVEVYEQGGQKAARVAPWDRAPDGKIGKTIIQL